MSDNSCGCFLVLIVLAILLRLSNTIGSAFSLNPILVFWGILLMIAGLLYFINYLLKQSKKKMESRFEEITKKYPKAYAKYITEKGHTDNSNIPLNFKKEVAKRTDYSWREEEITLEKKEQERIKREKEELQNKLNNELKHIETQFPNGLRIIKERMPEYNMEFLVRSKSLISNLEDEYQAEQERKREAEEKKREADLARLASNAPSVLSSKVKEWESLNGNFHYTWLFYYYPVNSVNDALPQEWEDRRTVWNFKNDPEKHPIQAVYYAAIDSVIPRIKQKLINTFGEEYLQFLTLVCLPASTKKKNVARYEEFSKRLCEVTGMENGYPHTFIINDGLSKNDPNNHTGRSIQPEVRFDDWIKGKNVLLFDDVVTRGGTMMRYKKMLEQKGANVIGGIALGKTKHERPVHLGIVSFDDFLGI